MALWNCEGLLKSLTVLTTADLKTYDVFIFTETWETRIIDIPQFHTVQSLAKKRDGPGRPSGGVTVIYNDNLENATCEIAEDDTIYVNANNCVIIALYINPSESLDEFEDSFGVFRLELPPYLFEAFTTFVNQWKEKTETARMEVQHLQIFTDKKLWEGTSTLYSSHTVFIINHKLCKDQSFNDPDVQCICISCEMFCDKYHSVYCTTAPPLAELAQNWCDIRKNAINEKPQGSLKQ